MRLARSLAVALLAACSGDAPDAPGGDQPGAPTRTVVAGLPQGWGVAGSSGSGFTAGVDTAVRRGGTRSATIVATQREGFHAIGQILSSAAYAGRRVRLTGWIRTRDVAAGSGGAVLWMRIDGGGGTIVNEPMSDRPTTGTTDWREASIVLDVPTEAAGLVVGAILSGGGQAWFDDLRLEAVGADVPTTRANGPIPGDSAAVEAHRAQYARYPARPVNLDFEGVRATALDSGAVAWLRQTAVPFERSEPGTPLADLAPLRAMVGDARVVALGEGTHGTREFFRMKHRVFEYLVRELGFTVFAIEATWPEANAVDLYVRTGVGDPAVLLSNLYFWTWNTQEVAELIAWMREHNRTAPAARQLRFFGVDMQSPGTAIDSAVAFVRRADPTRAAAVDSAYLCLAHYRNFGARAAASRYADATAPAKLACRAAVASVDSLVAAGRARYLAAGATAEEYARARQSARLVVQWEDMASQTVSATGSRRRDVYMAENTRWLLDQLPAGTRMMLWAHNYHVSAVPGAQGGHLRQALGADYLNVGFAFGAGSFNAVRFSEAGQAMGLTAMSTSELPPGAIEAYFGAVGAPRLILDARRIAGAAAAAPLAGPLPMRSIGSGFVPGRDLQYFGQTLLPNDHDLLIYFAAAGASTLLPFRFQ